jgi:hypothetical protein
MFLVVWFRFSSLGLFAFLMKLGSPESPPTPTPSRSCAIYQGSQSRLDLVDTNGCYVIVDCFFDHTSAGGGWGGAVAIGSSTDRGCLNSTTFLSCWTTGDHAGAILLQCLYAEMNRCCIRDGTCPRAGTAVYGNRANAVHSFRDSSFVECGDDNLNADGTIYITDPNDIDYSLLNFSLCTLDKTGSGAVVRFPETVRPWALRYCTILRCSGKNGIDSPDSSNVLVEYSNFYDNIADIGFLWGYKSGFNVSHCVFYNGTGPDIGLAQGSSPRFVIWNCVFTVGSLVEGCYDNSSAIDMNQFNSRTASIPLIHFHTHYCPGVSQSRSPSRSASPASEAVFPASVPFSASMKLRTQGRPRGVPGMRRIGRAWLKRRSLSRNRQRT